MTLIAWKRILEDQLLGILILCREFLKHARLYDWSDEIYIAVKQGRHGLSRSRMYIRRSKYIRRINIRHAFNVMFDRLFKEFI